MKKIFIIWSATILLASCGTSIEPNTTTESNNIGTINTVDRNQEILSLKPEYKAELYGKIKAVEWNVFTISEIDTSKDPTVNMELDEKKAYMMSLSDADRMALKDMIANSIKWDIKVMVPVWIPMIKKELVWEDKVDIEATLTDLKVWDIVSIWYNTDITDRKIAKYVKRNMRR